MGHKKRDASCIPLKFGGPDGTRTRDPLRDRRNNYLFFTTHKMLNAFIVSLLQIANLYLFIICLPFFMQILCKFYANDYFCMRQ